MIFGMNTNQTSANPSSITGSLLERWRTDNRLTKAEAAELFGLQKAKWDFLTHKSRSAELITDPAIAMLFYIYTQYPTSVPVKLDTDIKEFYTFLGLKDTPQDRDKFAILIGRATPSVYRLLSHSGQPSRPVIRWIEAVRRLGMTPKQSQRLMTEIASSVGECQHVDKVLIHGWGKQGSADDE
jgi:hypothetical protein